VVSREVTSQESVSESQEPFDSRVLATTVLDQSGLLSSVLPTQRLLPPGFWLLTSISLLITIPQAFVDEQRDLFRPGPRRLVFSK
jgi:hypothetical protein